MSEPIAVIARENAIGGTDTLRGFIEKTQLVRTNGDAATGASGGNTANDTTNGTV